MPSAIQPAPILVDPRNETVKATSDGVISIIKFIVSTSKKSLWSTVWANPKKTPIECAAELGAGGVTCFGEYTGFATFLAAVTATFGITLKTLDSSITTDGPIGLDPVPDGWTVTPNMSTGQIAVTPPSASVPTNLSVSQRTLTWAPIPGAIGYSIKRSEDAGVTFQEIIILKSPSISGGGQVALVPSATSWVDVDIVPSGTQYQIAAQTAAGLSSYSAPVTLA